MAGLEQNMQTLKAENDRLERKLYFKDRELKDVQKDLDTANTLIEELTAKNAELRRLLEARLHDTPRGSALSLTEDEFRSIMAITPDTNPRQGLECGWSEVMVAFSDPIFRRQNYPDVVLYRDDEHRCYHTLEGDVRLAYPITQELLDTLGWEGVRPITEEESNRLVRNYQL